MRLSIEWLQSFFEKDLPSVDKIAQAIEKHFVEVEEIEKCDDGDTVLVVDVLPNRAGDSLSYMSFAKEVGAYFSLPLKRNHYEELAEVEGLGDMEIKISEDSGCRRFVAIVMEGVSVGKSPDWLVKRLEKMGQKAINGVIDVSNYIMFEFGYPIHIYDADKLGGGKNSIAITKAKQGEEIDLLGGESVSMRGEDIVIRDGSDNSPLALAGVRGGAKAEVDENTKRIVVEVASFLPNLVRDSTRAHSIKTEASDRFSKSLSSLVLGNVSRGATKLLEEVSGGRVVARKDVFPKKENQRVVGVSVKEINDHLGTALSEKDCLDVFERLLFKFEVVSDVRDKIVTTAKKYVGVPYEFGSSIIRDAPKKFDCSSFTSYCYVWSGVAIPRISVNQFLYGDEIQSGEVKEGDVVFSYPQAYSDKYKYTNGVDEPLFPTPFTKRSVKEPITHCGIYVGGGKVIHASGEPESKVVEESISESKKFQNGLRYSRILQNEDPRIVVSVPIERTDIFSKEDLIEEVGRIVGYDGIKKSEPKKERQQKANKEFAYKKLIINELTEMGFSQIETSVFGKEGDIKVIKPHSADKERLRKSLANELKNSLIKNSNNADLLGLSSIRIFEIGKVFDKNGERLVLGIGMSNKKGTAGKEEKSDFDLVCEKLAAKNIKLNDSLSDSGVFEVDFETIIKDAPDIELPTFEDKKINYEKFSSFPPVLRDISLFVPADVSAESVGSLIEKESGEFLVRKTLFDKFEKDGKVSFAFRLVFQSKERTLTDSEVGEIMKRIESSINNKPNWSVR
ncbi:MAG: phenylalanine--tRNA ligase beta subunit-related protein [Candidatus Campbellbacteria bacterium]|nr:phenylalanine--tRNA ligase beta subunit-related protein [Candidatus Campbellbacteria bacterium]